MPDDQRSLAIPSPDVDPDGAITLGRKLAEAYVEMAAFYRDRLQKASGDALRLASSVDDVEDLRQRLMTESPDQITWFELQLLVEHDPDAGARVWRRLLAHAADELASGHRAAEALELDGEVWERAQFLALRAGFVEEWQPRGGIELALIDTLAQSYSMQQYWLHRLHVQNTLDWKNDDAERKKRGYLVPARVDQSASMDQAAAMVDRFNRLFMRTLRALRDLRRYAPAVTIQHAGQVNVGQQQVNLLGPERLAGRTGVSENEAQDNPSVVDSRANWRDGLALGDA